MLANRPDPHHVQTAVFDGPLELLLYLIRRDGIDVRESLAARIVSEGWGLIELAAIDLSLEDVFLDLVTEEDRGGDG